LLLRNVRALGIPLASGATVIVTVPAAVQTVVGSLSFGRVTSLCAKLYIVWVSAVFSNVNKSTLYP